MSTTGTQKDHREREAIYQWRVMFPSKKVDPAIAAKTFEDIRAKNGGQLTAALVVEAARGRKHPLHKLFEWDDTKAAEEYRLHQARGVINALQVTYVNPGVTVRAYEKLKAVESEPRGDVRYATMKEILEDEEQRDNLLVSALRDLQALRRKYSALSELSHFIPVVDTTIEQLQAAIAES